MTDPINYSRTHRILLLIDLHPILIANPKSYLQAVRAAAEAILTFPSLSSSLFSFKFFYSSLPLLSYPTKPPLLLRFEESTETLGLLTEALKSLSGVENQRDEVAARCCKASFVEMALRQVLHGYKWEEEEGESGMDFGVVRSNLVLVLSPVCDSVGFAAEFMDAVKGDETVGSVDTFIGKFRDVFEYVGNAYCRNDMHLAWIDVKTEVQCKDCDVVDVECEFGNELFKEGLKSMGWGFCSTDSVILGSALVPMGLIYPSIGLSSIFRNYDSSSKKCRAQLNLELSDKSGKPLECKCCDLELIETNLVSRNKQKVGYQGQGLICMNNEGNKASKKSLFDHTNKDAIKLHVQAVMKYSECQKMKSRLRDIVLVTESGRKSVKQDVNVSDEFYAAKVLKRLKLETGQHSETNVPLWNILLSYLYKENHWGLVSLTDGDRNSYTGILKPFTFDSALLFIVDSVSWPHTEAGELDITQSVKDADVKSLSKDEKPGTEDYNVPLSQDGNKSRKKSRLLKSLDWSAFCEMAYGSFRADIADAYFTASTGKSKKLKFLQCWLKQIKKRNSNHYITIHPEQHLTPLEFTDRLLQSSEAELPLSSLSPVSVGENYLVDIDRTQDAEASGLVSETSECFLGNLTKRIQDGLGNESLDLGAFSERIVNSAIQSLRVKLANEDAPLNADALHTDSLTRKIAGELIALLLMDPKDMKAKHTNSEKNLGVDHLPSNDESEAIRRRYELQILFRMEIIRSEVATCISESMKHKFVKQICMLLERIQCHLDGGFLGDWSLDSYLAKFLKTRYLHDLKDILHHIYREMDLLLYSEEDENFNLLLNSEDSSQSFKEQLEDDSFGETKLHGAGNKSYEKPKGKSMRSFTRNNSTNHMLKLEKAQEQRERARRFSSFTSWIPDLQRVWAPKHQTQKVTRSKSDLSRKQYKRPSRQSGSLDMVFETPESNKKSCSRRSLDTPCSASKALFQDSQ